MPILTQKRDLDLALVPSREHVDTHLRIRLRYDGSKRVVLNVFPVAIDGPSTVAPFFENECGQLVLDDMPNLNRKNVDALFELICTDIRNREGKAWDFVITVLAANGLELA